MQAKILLRPMHLARYFKVVIITAVQNEDKNFVNI